MFGFAVNIPTDGMFGISVNRLTDWMFGFAVDTPTDKGVGISVNRLTSGM
jgi:hypothetical protein